MKTISKFTGLLLALVMAVSLFGTAVSATSSTYVGTTYSMTYSVQIADSIPPVLQTMSDTGVFGTATTLYGAEQVNPILVNTLGASAASTYTFTGWTIDGTFYAAGASFNPTVYKSGYIAYAVFKTPKVVIGFTAGSSNLSTTVTGTLPTPITTTPNGTFTFPTTDLARRNYTFAGWLFNGHVYLPGETYTLSDVSLSSMDSNGYIYLNAEAFWTENANKEYILYLTPGVASTDENPIKPVEYGTYAANTELNIYSIPCPFTPAGLKFVCWNYKSTSFTEQYPTLKITEDTFLSAQWEEITSSVESSVVSSVESSVPSSQESSQESSATSSKTSSKTSSAVSSKTSSAASSVASTPAYESMTLTDPATGIMVSGTFLNNTTLTVNRLSADTETDAYVKALLGNAVAGYDITLTNADELSGFSGSIFFPFTPITLTEDTAVVTYHIMPYAQYAAQNNGSSLLFEKDADGKYAAQTSGDPIMATNYYELDGYTITKVLGATAPTKGAFMLSADTVAVFTIQLATTGTNLTGTTVSFDSLSKFVITSALYDSAAVPGSTENTGLNPLVWVGIGVAVLAAFGIVIILLSRKKTPKKPHLDEDDDSDVLMS
ncbi:MAG TPA: hypothetical protein PK629_04590 [Oscillospiraceae bacterium]|nr:hypothetical protein [Oscillospiraceae bacterium]HPF56685.1 hypothetical protein [Clostridiales bacterium]HPK34824.1 hypothetical protein [Oscillospiraceae bacterium]HPR76784.1 hypothetical protein [Oscillospiraceae bacterium]